GELDLCQPGSASGPVPGISEEAHLGDRSRVTEGHLTAAGPVTPACSEDRWGRVETPRAAPGEALSNRRRTRVRFPPPPHLGTPCPPRARTGGVPYVGRGGDPCGPHVPVGSGSGCGPGDLRRVAGVGTAPRSVRFRFDLWARHLRWSPAWGDPLRAPRSGRFRFGLWAR